MKRNNEKISVDEEMESQENGIFFFNSKRK